MGGIKWVQAGEIDIGDSQIPSMVAKVGGFYITPAPIIRISHRTRRGVTFIGNGNNKIIDWRHAISYEEEFISLTKNSRSEETSQKNAEKLVIEYLRGNAFETLKELKKIGLLEEALSEIGIDI